MCVKQLARVLDRLLCANLVNRASEAVVSAPVRAYAGLATERDRLVISVSPAQVQCASDIGANRDVLVRDPGITACALNRDAASEGAERAPAIIIRELDGIVFQAPARNLVGYGSVCLAGAPNSNCRQH